MIRNKIFLTNFDKFLKCKFRNKSKSLFCLFGLTARHINSQKVFGPVEINSLYKSISLNRKLREIRSNEKYISKLSDTKCWNCKQSLHMKDFTCTSCGALQYPKPKVNFFELLGISQMYDVDLEELSKRFRNLQMIFHPDKFVNKSKEELEISETYSRLLNKAYTTLKDPVSRGFYLLEFQKISAESNNTLEQDFLLNVMEENEKLENVENLNSLLKLMKANNENIEKQISAIRDAFRSSKWNDAKINLVKLKYYINLNNKIKEKQSDFNSSKNI